MANDQNMTPDLDRRSEMVVAIPPAVAGLGQLTEATKWQSATTLASAIIIASGRPHSIQQALDIARDIHFAMFPAHNLGAYKDWEKTKHERLSKVHGQS
jgi:hypothetical protein